MPEKFKKILIIKLRAIGDVVMSTVVLDNLRAAYPKARIDFLTETESKDIVFGNPILNQVLVFDRKRVARLPFWKKMKENLHLIARIRNQKYDIVFDFFGNPRSAWLTFLSGAETRIGYNYRFRKFAYNVVAHSRADQVHEVDWHLDALKEMELPIKEKRISVAIGEGSKNLAETFWHEAGLAGYPVIAIHFSGGWPTKKWPLDRFAHLIDLLSQKYDAKIILVWGPGEKDEAEKLQGLATAPTTLIPKTTLKQLAAILAKADLMVTTDSGPMHIAAAMGTPCVALFGPTNPQLQGPYGDFHEIVRQEELECLGCNLLSCSHHSCMTMLSVSDVLNGIDRCVQKNDLFVL